MGRFVSKHIINVDAETWCTTQNKKYHQNIMFRMCHNEWDVILGIQKVLSNKFLHVVEGYLNVFFRM